MSKPNLFIVGAPKCGTSSLYEYLKQHPQILMSTRKEPHYFGSDLRRQHLNSYRTIRTEADYLALFQDAAEDVIGEASTSYFYSLKAAAEIKAFNPDSKIVIMLREPVEMMYSLYYQLYQGGVEDASSFDLALVAEEARQQGKNIPKLAHIVDNLRYRYIAHYSQHIQRYFNEFGREHVMVIIFDDFRADTHAVLMQLFDFLGVDKDIKINLSIANPNSYARNKLLRNFLVNPPEIVLTLGKRILPIARPIYQQLVRSNTKIASRPPMDATLQEKLQREFYPEIEELSQLLNRDLSAWTKIK